MAIPCAIWPSQWSRRRTLPPTCSRHRRPDGLHHRRMLPPRAWFRPSTIALAIGALRATKHITPGRLTHWWDALGGQPPLTELRTLLESILQRSGGRATLKRQPDVVAIKRDFARKLAADLDQGGPQQALQAAHRLATMDMRDAAAFRLYLGLVGLANAATFDQLRTALGSRVVMHLSCESRVARAQESCQSFAVAEGHGVAQVIVIGSATAHGFSYQPQTRVLTVPAPDTYEHLTAKVVAAMFCFALLGRTE